MATVFANGRSITHKGDGQTNIAAPPDVCKTPSPGGPVPIPYVNIAKTSDLAKGSKKVKIEDNPAALKSSNLSTSTGDEPGTAGGGIISSKTKGKLTWGTSSPDVKIEGKNVVRFMDVAQHNGNSFNTAFIEQGGTGLANGDEVCDHSWKEVSSKTPEQAKADNTAEAATLDSTDPPSAKGPRFENFAIDENMDRLNIQKVSVQYVCTKCGQKQEVDIVGESQIAETKNSRVKTKQAERLRDIQEKMMGGGKPMAKLNTNHKYFGRVQKGYKREGFEVEPLSGFGG